MEIFKIKDLSFTYPDRENKAIDNISININQGEFVCFCGKSGCGKTTFLRLLKSAIAPFGNVSGKILFRDELLSAMEQRVQAAKIGFVMQDVDNQIVTDKVWHELAFGLESLGFATSEIRTRVAEMSSFFGINEWFHKKVTELSGGQKQLLNLASVMVMQPDVLILDEPTSQLDPIAASEFLKTLEKINRELGTTIILSEHRLEEVFPISDRVIVMEGGRVIADDSPKRVGEILKERKHDIYYALPTPMRVYGAVANDMQSPLTVREGRMWIEDYAKKNMLNPDLIPQTESVLATDTVIELQDVWFRYEKGLSDVLKGLNLQVNKGEIFAVLGGNGSGKTTMLSLISGLNVPYRGKVIVNGESISKIENLYDGVLGVLPQNPQSLFVKKTVYLDLMEMLSDRKISKEEKEEKIKNIAFLCHIDKLLESHPYDLSGGEQQRAALAKVLLKNPEILLLDEPTKGFDAHFKMVFAEILENLKLNGVTVVIVSHDIEFCAEHADRCAMFFDGNISSTAAPREFFAGNSFYTTGANRMARNVLPTAILADDIILCCGGSVPKNNSEEKRTVVLNHHETKTEISATAKKKLTPQRLVAGCIFAIIFILTLALQLGDKNGQINSVAIQLISLAEITACLACLLPWKELGIKTVQQPQSGRKLAKRTILATLFVLLAVPLTIYIGIYYLGDRRYYFVSLMIILETMLPFCIMFENRKPQARELVVISVLCAIAVAGRMAFFMLHQFKPLLALIIIAGVCFGGETGFLVGAVTGFVSNIFFGQGPWTPWQMFALGIVGFVAGILFRKGFLIKNRISLCVFGFLSTLIIYGGIMNPASVIMMQLELTRETILSAYAMGLPLDLVHAASTAFFLWFISEPMIDKLERIKTKYGIIGR